MEDIIDKLEIRVGLIEMEVKALSLSNARAEANQLNIINSLNEIKKNQKHTEDKIESMSSWASRLIIGALVLAVLNFIIGGGLIL